MAAGDEDNPRNPQDGRGVRADLGRWTTQHPMYNDPERFSAQGEPLFGGSFGRGGAVNPETGMTEQEEWAEWNNPSAFTPNVVIPTIDRANGSRSDRGIEDNPMYGGRRTPDNLRPRHDDGAVRDGPPSGDTVTSNYGIARYHNLPTAPVGLIQRGVATSASPWQAAIQRGVDRARTQQTGTANRPGDAGFGANAPGPNAGRVDRSLPPTGQFTNTDDYENSSRFFGDLYSGAGGGGSTASGFASDDERDGYFDFIEGSVLGPGDAAAFNEPNAGSAIMALMRGSGGIRGFLDRAIALSFDNPGAFTELQMQLTQHGFMSADPVYGTMDSATIQAITQMINGKWQVGDNQNFSEYLADANDAYFDKTFGDMDSVFAAEDQAKADELKFLREQMDSIDLEVNLSDPAAVRDAINAESMARIGRRLDDSEIDAMIGEVHENQRSEFWENNMDVKRYNELLRQWEDVNTNATERSSQVVNGLESSDVDEFLSALGIQESNGNPNAVNASGSGAKGTFQFLDSTWRNTARKAGLNPNDRSAENQYAMARYLASSYFVQFGNWHDVAKAWYAGEGGVDYSDAALNRTQYYNGDPYPSINSYADSVLEKMGGFNEEADSAASLGFSGMGSLPAEARESIIRAVTGANKKRAQAEETAGLSDLDREMAEGPGQYSVYENTGWDMAAFLKQSTLEAGGADVDTFSFANRAMDFYTLLGER